MKYEVVFEPYAERHFIRTFAKKYQGAWDRTLKGLILEFSLVDLLFEKNIAETVTDSKDVKICKTEFKIAGTDISRKASGNRCIIAVHKEIGVVKVLLVYHHGDLVGRNETTAWRKIVQENFDEYKHLF